MATSRIARPTVDTPFHISLEWWSRRRLDFDSHLREALCPDCQRRFPSSSGDAELDFIDSLTGEVRPITEIWDCLVATCAGAPDFLAADMPLATAIFRALLGQGNSPLSPNQLHRLLGRSNPQTILRVLTGSQVMLGVIPAE